MSLYGSWAASDRPATAPPGGSRLNFGGGKGASSGNNVATRKCAQEVDFDTIVALSKQFTQELELKVAEKQALTKIIADAKRANARYQAQPSVCLGRPFLDNLAQCVRGASMDSLDWGELGAKSIAIKAKVQVKLEMVRLEVELKDFQTALPRAIMLSDDGIWQMKPLEEDEPEIAFPGTCHGNPIEIIANALGMQDFNVNEIDLHYEKLHGYEEVSCHIIQKATIELLELCLTIKRARDDLLPAVKKVVDVPVCVKSSRSLSQAYTRCLKSIRDEKRKLVEGLRSDAIRALNVVGTPEKVSEAKLKVKIKTERALDAVRLAGAARRGDLLHWEEQLSLIQSSLEGVNSIRSAFMKAKSVEKGWTERYGANLFTCFTRESKLKIKNLVKSTDEHRELLSDVAPLAYLDPQAFTSFAKLGRDAPLVPSISAREALMDANL